MQWCEKAARKVLPAIRREIVILLKREGKSQKEIAKCLGITPAAVTQYLKGRRARITLKEEEKREIEKMVRRGIKKEELCRICRKIGERIA